MNTKQSLENRVPPGRHLTSAFPVLHHGEVPYYRDVSSQWNLRLFGLVDADGVKILYRTEDKSLTDRRSISSAGRTIFFQGTGCSFSRIRSISICMPM